MHRHAKKSHMHIKDSVVHVRVRWFMETQINQCALKKIFFKRSAASLLKSRGKLCVSVLSGNSDVFSHIETLSLCSLMGRVTRWSENRWRGWWGRSWNAGTQRPQCHKVPAGHHPQTVVDAMSAPALDPTPGPMQGLVDFFNFCLLGRSSMGNLLSVK